ncbi:MAG: hypothetical protein ABR563_14190 [Pyrinomonadaceae bacterium]
MPIKIENYSKAKLPKGLTNLAERILGILPREHLRGVERLRLVDAINDPRIKTRQYMKLPGLYHPKQGQLPAWFEISTNFLTGAEQPFHQRLVLRLSFKSNLAAIIFSLAGQHYFTTLRHSVKRGQLEPAIHAYTEKYLKIWGHREHKFRAKIFKPFESRLERWGKSLRKSASKKRAGSERTSS